MSTFVTDAAFFERLRAKWSTVPFSLNDRRSTEEMLAMSDRELEAAWEFARSVNSDGPEGFSVRGWYQLLYRDWVAGRKILDIGAGLGIDSVYFAQCGADVTFVDLLSTNLGVIKRICELKGLRQGRFHVMHTVEDLDRLDTDYDAVFGFGSLMNAPESVMKPEFDALVRRLKPHGRFIMHAYPKARWEREGRVPFDRWGEQTDGPGTPWAEWYDTRKLQTLLLPSRFEPVLYCEYYKGAMNCIDLLNVTGDPQFEERPLPASAILLEGATGLGSLCVYDYWPGAALQADHSVTTLTTSPGTWSYSAEIQIDRSRVPAGSPLYLQLTLQVCEGEIGIGALDPDGTRFVVERQFEPQGAFVTVVLEIPSPPEIGLVIIRNTRRDGLPSTASFQSIALYTQGPQTASR